MTQITRAALDRLGIDDDFTPDLAGLKELYEAWCFSVPFDNIRKIIHLKREAAGESTGETPVVHIGETPMLHPIEASSTGEAPMLHPIEASSTGETPVVHIGETPMLHRSQLPGITPDDFLRNWLEHKTGGTCWPSANALYEIVTSAGFRASRATGSMFDMGIDNHGTIIVHLDEGDFIVDSSMLTIVPLPLKRGEVFISDHPFCKAEVDPEGDGFYFWVTSPPIAEMLLCRMLAFDVPAELYGQNFERSREMSPFNHRLYVRQNFSDHIGIIAGNALFKVFSEGMEVTELDAQELLAQLVGPFGYSSAIIGDWEACGGLAAAMEPPSAMELPKIERVRPSRR